MNEDKLKTDAWLLSLFTDKPLKTPKLKVEVKVAKSAPVVLTPTQPTKPFDYLVMFATKVTCLSCGDSHVASSAPFARQEHTRGTVHFIPQVDVELAKVERRVEWKEEEFCVHCYRCFDLAERMAEINADVAAGQTPHHAPMASTEPFNLEDLFNV